MADKDNEEEYQFDEFETMEHEPGEESPEEPQYKEPRRGTNVRRNAFIVVVLVALLMLAYKFFSSFVTVSKAPTAEIPKLTVTQTQPPATQPTTQVPPPSETTPPTTTTPPPA